MRPSTGRMITMAEYLILIAEDENAYAAATPDVYQQVMEAHIRFAEQVPEKGGKIVEGRAQRAGERLAGSRENRCRCG